MFCFSFLIFSPERDVLQDKHNAIVALLNQQMADKARYCIN